VLNHEGGSLSEELAKVSVAGKIACSGMLICGTQVLKDRALPDRPIAYPNTPKVAWPRCFEAGWPLTFALQICDGLSGEITS
jgi:hypothetical protein